MRENVFEATTTPNSCHSSGIISYKLWFDGVEDGGCWTRKRNVAREKKGWAITKMLLCSFSWSALATLYSAPPMSDSRFVSLKSTITTKAGFEASAWVRMNVSLPIDAETPYKRGNFRDSHTVNETRKQKNWWICAGKPQRHIAVHTLLTGESDCQEDFGRHQLPGLGPGSCGGRQVPGGSDTVVLPAVTGRQNILRCLCSQAEVGKKKRVPYC